MTVAGLTKICRVINFMSKFANHFPPGSLTIRQAHSRARSHAFLPQIVLYDVVCSSYAIPSEQPMSVHVTNAKYNSHKKVSYKFICKFHTVTVPKRKQFFIMQKRFQEQASAWNTTKLLPHVHPYNEILLHEV